MLYNIRRVCSNCFVALLHTIGALATEMTILGYMSSLYEHIGEFLKCEVVLGPTCRVSRNLIIQALIFCLLFIAWVWWGNRHAFVDKRLVKVKKFKNGDKLYYFPNSSQLKNGTIIQIMKTERDKSSDPYAIGIVDSCDEGNERLMLVKHLEYLNGSQDSIFSKKDLKKYFYYPYLRAYYFKETNQGGNEDAK